MKRKKMVEKKFGIVCNKCKSILTENGECFCGNLALLKRKNFWFIYTDDEDSFSFILGYFEDDRALKIIDLGVLFEYGNIIEINEEVLNKIKYKEE